MSVTSQLRNKRGPLWYFFEEFENTEGIKSITSSLRASSTPTRPDYNGSYKYSLTGAAFPYAAHTLLPKNKLYKQYKLGGPANLKFNLNSSVAFNLADYRHPIYWDFKELIDGLISLATDMLSNKKDINSIAKGSVIFAILENSARGGTLPKPLINLYRKHKDVKSCIEIYLHDEINSEQLELDIIKLIKNFLKVNKPSCNIFNNAKYFCLGKTLAHSTSVGGADIDVALVRGKNISIIDYKTILKPIDHYVTRQILSYALLWDRSIDGNNMNLSKIGIYYVRTAELKEITLANALKKAFPSTSTFKETRKQLISSFSKYAEDCNAIEEIRALSRLKEKSW